MPPEGDLAGGPQGQPVAAPPRPEAARFGPDPLGPTETPGTWQETGIKTIAMEKKCKKAKWLSGEALQIAVKRREAKSKGEEERYKHLYAESSYHYVYC